MSESTAIQKQDRDKIIERVISKGDLSDLTPEQRISYYNHVCQSLKLNPLTKPFDFVEIADKKTGQTKVVLYANKECAAQLRDNNQVSIHKLDQETKDGCLIVTAYARTPGGKEDVDQGVVFVKGLIGESLANAIKKAITQAKRRVTLSICGLGFIDESEIDSIPNAQPISHPEAEAVMTEGEAEQVEQLTIAHKASGLDQWKCGRGLAMQLINVCKDLAAKGVDDELMRSRLPGGVQSRKDLTPGQAMEAIKAFTHWLKTYDETAQEGVVTNG